MHMIHNHYININIHTYNVNGLAKKFIQVYSILWNNSKLFGQPYKYTYMNIHALVLFL